VWILAFGDVAELGGQLGEDGVLAEVQISRTAIAAHRLAGWRCRHRRDRGADAHRRGALCPDGIDRGLAARTLGWLCWSPTAVRAGLLTDRRSVTQGLSVTRCKVSFDDEDSDSQLSRLRRNQHHLATPPDSPRGGNPRRLAPGAHRGIRVSAERAACWKTPAEHSNAAGQPLWPCTRDVAVLGCRSRVILAVRSPDQACDVHSQRSLQSHTVSRVAWRILRRSRSGSPAPHPWADVGLIRAG
jgi:hypothetical protein